MYRDKGYRFAEATYSLEEVSPTERRVLFSIDEAEKVRIGDIDFQGNDVLGNLRLRWTMRKTKETNLLWRMLKRDIYNPATVAEDLQKVKESYRSIGYKDVIVEEPRLETTGKGGKRRLRLAIPIDEGKRFKLGEITIEGNEVFSDQNLLRQFKRPRGGWLRSKTIEDGIKAIDEAYRNYGHIFAAVSTELEDRDGNVSDLVVKITEGDQYRVHMLEFEGNTRTRDKVLRREFRVQEGTLLNMGALKNSLFKINQLGYFKLNEDDPILFENFDSTAKTVDLKVVGEEADRTELQVGGGWSEIDGFFGQLSVRTQNFMGRGESLGVSFQSGRYRDEFNVSYFVPWLFDRPQSVGLQVFNSDLDYTFLSSQRVVRKSEGAVLTYGRSFGFFNSFSLSLNRSELRDRRSAFNLDGELVEQEYELSNASLRPAYNFDSRDSRLEPTVGKRISASLEYAGGFLGGDNYFWRPELGFSWFKPLSYVPVKTVFAINSEAGYIEPFSGRELSFLERYFLGGETSVRGFRFRSIWVRCEGGEPFPNRPDQPCAPDETLVDEFGFPFGGNKFFQLNLEYHVLVGGPFRVLAFIDAGNVYGDDQSFDLGRLRSSAGAELRIFVPVFGAPLRFIYASNLDPQPDDRFESFQFSIGATF
jgi:outer membrane protein insertion porin family